MKNDLEEFEKLFDDSKDSSALLLKREVTKSKLNLETTLDDIQPGGCTALGLAWSVLLVFAL